MIIDEFSDRPVNPDEIIPCPAICQDEYVHRHLSNGTIQWMFKGFGIDEDGELVRGPRVRK